jgi:hypothetical protein
MTEAMKQQRPGLHNIADSVCVRCVLLNVGQGSIKECGVVREQTAVSIAPRKFWHGQIVVNSIVRTRRRSSYADHTRHHSKTEQRRHGFREIS